MTTLQHLAHREHSTRRHSFRNFFNAAVGLALVMLVAPAQAVNIGDIEMPDTLKAGGVSLTLNGAGKRSMVVATPYVAGLYLKQPETAAQTIINADETMAIRLQVASSLATAKRMEKAARKGFKNSAGEQLSAIADRVDATMAVFQQGVAEGDIYEFIWVPGTGTQVIKNAKLFSVIKGLDFKKALFGIWIGNKPVQKSLKADLLGG